MEDAEIRVFCFACGKALLPRIAQIFTNEDTHFVRGTAVAKFILPQRYEDAKLDENLFQNLDLTTEKQIT